IKCGSVSYPAVPKQGCLLRFSVNARHRAEDLDKTVETLAHLRTRLQSERKHPTTSCQEQHLQ
ncbi:MAG TPA: hypothetical protein VIV60_09400, partial [Polyangiaceae bacterium]